jgi:taurine transport system permease protein
MNIWMRLFPGVSRLFKIWKYLIPLFLIFLFKQWFGNSTYGEYLFVSIMVMGYLKISFFESIDLVKEEYILSAKSLGLQEKEMSKKIIWKSVQPYIFKTIQENHIIIWSYTILYEYICDTLGVGTILITAVKYNDFGIIILIIAFLILSFILMDIVLKKIQQKFFFWN